MVQKPEDVKPQERPILRAILEAKKKFGPLIKDKNNPFYKSKYADLAALMDVVEGPLLEQDVVILQPTVVKESGQYVLTRLVHVTGDEVQGDIEIPKGLDVQKTVAAITYLKRATLQALLAIPAKDDDGEGAMGRTEDTQTPPSTPKTFTTDPRKAAKEKQKEQEKATPPAPPPGKDDGTANVVVQSIGEAQVKGIKCSVLVTTGGRYLVDTRKIEAVPMLKTAQEASMSRENVIIEYRQSGENMVVKSLKMEKEI